MNKSIATISPQQLHDMLSDGEDINLIDVRTADEYRRGHVASARLITLDELSAASLEAAEVFNAAWHEKPLYLMCHTGPRALIAADRLMKLGYYNLVLIEGGMQAWQNTGLPIQSYTPAHLASQAIWSSSRNSSEAVTN